MYLRGYVKNIQDLKIKLSVLRLKCSLLFLWSCCWEKSMMKIRTFVISFYQKCRTWTPSCILNLKNVKTYCCSSISNKIPLIRRIKILFRTRKHNWKTIRLIRLFLSLRRWHKKQREAKKQCPTEFTILLKN